MKNFILLLSMIILSQSCSHKETTNDKPAQSSPLDSVTSTPSQLPSTPKNRLERSSKWKFVFNLDDSEIVQGDEYYFIGNVDNVGHIRNRVGFKPKLIGYISIGSWEEYRKDQSLLKPFCKKNYSGYKDECWLDLSKYLSYIDVMYRRIDKIKSDGYDGVYFDNCSMYMHEVGTLEQNVEYVKRLAQYASFHGLYVACNNGYKVIEKVADYMDFQVQESCTKYEECGFYDAIVKQNKPVFHIEFSTKYCKPVKGHSVKVYNDELNKLIKSCDNN